MKFKSTSNYIATDELILAVNSSITIERPLLIKGEPGTGKTQLAEELAKHLDTEIISWHVKSSSKAQHGLYEYDTVSRLRDSQFGEEKVKDISNYIKKGPLWRAFEAKKVVLLIDEIDKADLEFPNDLLLELDKMEFYVYELQKKIQSKNRPIVIITSNNEKELPDAFLRRCFFHYIKFPDENTLKKNHRSSFSKIKSKMVNSALQKFFDVRNTPGLKKKPSTSELIDWLQLLLSDDIDPSSLNDEKNALPSLYGALLKNEQDVEMFEKLMFISRGQK